MSRVLCQIKRCLVQCSAQERAFWRDGNWRSSCWVWYFPLTVPKINADKSEDPAKCVIDFCSDYLRKWAIQFSTSPDFDWYEWRNGHKYIFHIFVLWFHALFRESSSMACGILIGTFGKGINDWFMTRATFRRSHFGLDDDTHCHLATYNLSLP